MYIELSASLILMIGIVLWAMGGPSHYQRYSWEQRQDQARARAEARAAWQVAKAARQAARRRLFGSHPVLYGLLAWMSPVLLAFVLYGLFG